MGVSISTTRTTQKLNLKRELRKNQDKNVKKPRHRKQFIAEQGNQYVPVIKKTSRQQGKSPKFIQNNKISINSIQLGPDNIYQIGLQQKKNSKSTANSHYKQQQIKQKPFVTKQSAIKNKNSMIVNPTTTANPQSYQNISLQKISQTNRTTDYLLEADRRPTSIQQSRNHIINKQRSTSLLHDKRNKAQQFKQKRSDLQTQRIKSYEVANKQMQRQRKKKDQLLIGYKDSSQIKLTNNVYQGRSSLSRNSFIRDNSTYSLKKDKTSPISNVQPKLNSPITFTQKNDENIVKLNTDQVLVNEMSPSGSQKYVNKYKVNLSNSKNSAEKHDKYNELHWNKEKSYKNHHRSIDF